MHITFFVNFFENYFISKIIIYFFIYFFIILFRFMSRFYIRFNTFYILRNYLNVQLRIIDSISIYLKNKSSIKKIFLFLFLKKSL